VVTPISLYSQWREIYAPQKEGRGRNLFDLFQVTALGWDESQPEASVSLHRLQRDQASSA